MRQIQTFAAFIIACAGISLASSIVVPFLLAVFIAVAVSPLMALMMRYHVPRAISLLLVFAIFGYVFYIFGSILATTGASLANDMPMYQARFEGVINSAIAWLEAHGIALNTDGLIKDNLERGLSSATALFKGTSEIITKSFLVLLLIVFMIFEQPIFAQKIENFGGSASSVMHNFANNLKRYVIIKTISSIATALILLPALWYFNVPYAMFLALLAFALNYIPTVGSTIAAVPAILLCLLAGEPIDTLWLSVYYIVINIAIGNFIEPKFLGHGLGISTLVVVLSLIFWGFLLGIGGMFLAVPLTMSIKLALNESKNFRFIAVLLSDKAENKDEK